MEFNTKTKFWNMKNCHRNKHSLFHTGTVWNIVDTILEMRTHFLFAEIQKHDHRWRKEEMREWWEQRRLGTGAIAEGVREVWVDEIVEMADGGMEGVCCRLLTGWWTTPLVLSIKGTKVKVFFSDGLHNVVFSTLSESNWKVWTS